MRAFLAETKNGWFCLHADNEQEATEKMKTSDYGVDVKRIRDAEAFITFYNDEFSESYRTRKPVKIGMSADEIYRRQGQGVEVDMKPTPQVFTEKVFEPFVDTYKKGPFE